MISIDDLILKLKGYEEEDIAKIKFAYEYARDMHKGQYRQSGEEYITHPLNVAYILADMHADTDTICAGLLHDTLEDTKTTKEDLIRLFNNNVANLVDGVTKISKMNFSSENEQNAANTRKIITSITNDVRIIIIKLADRLHNMRTLEFKSEYKQKENAIETMEIFVPLAYYIGAYIREYKVTFNKWINLFVLLFTIFLDGVILYYYLSGNSIVTLLTTEYYTFSIIISTLTFLLLYNIDIRNKIINKIVSFLSKVSFGTYLVSYCFDIFVYNKTISLQNSHYYFFICAILLSPVIFLASSIFSYFVSIIVKYIRSFVDRIFEEH